MAVHLKGFRLTKAGKIVKDRKALPANKRIASAKRIKPVSRKRATG